MEEIKPKKEKRFLKAVGNVAGILIQEFVLGLGRKFIGKKLDKIGNKRQALLIFLALFCNIAWASVDSIPYPITTNKQRLGWQTSGNGLVYRGRASDTITKPTSYADKNVKAYLILDSVSGSLYVFKQGVWAAISGAGGGLTMPFDSITFNTAKDGTVGVGEVEYNDTQGSLIQGLKGGNVTNVIGQQLHQRVNNRTGAALAKGDVVYLSGSQGNRITVAKALATSDPTSANTFGIVAESIADNASGYVITEGLITGLNTSALTQDSAVYLSGTTAGALTSTKPQAPIHGVYIGVCVKSNAGSGEIFVKIRNGSELDELHDVQITSPVNNASLYYKSSEGLWRDTTAALLVSDTASMLTNYLRTGVAASTYLTQSNAASSYLPLTGGTLSGDLGISKSSNSILRLSSADVSSYGKLIFSSNNGGFLNYGASIESSGDGVGVDVGSLNFLTGYGTVRTNRMTITPTGNLTIVNSATIGGTLGVTGATTLNESLTVNRAGVPLFINSTNSNLNKISLQDNTTVRSYLGAGSTKLFTVANSSVDEKFSVSNDGNTVISGSINVNSSAVFNEGSADADFRVESDGNANMVFVDASTDRVGIGTNAPTKTLDVNGEVKIATTTATPTSLLGKDGSNVVGNVRVITPLTLAGDSINLNTVPISKGGTGSTSESGARSNLGVGYVFYASTAGDAIQLSSNKVFIVNSGGASTTTITLGTATAGRLYIIKNLATGTVISDSSNVIPLNGGSAGTAILSAGNLTTQWCTLVCDGTNWHIMQSN